MKSYVLIEKYKGRLCTKCLTTKPSTLYFFNKCNKVKSKLSAKCKVCIKLYYDNNRDSILDTHKEYYLNNKLFLQQKQRDYNKNNKTTKQESGKKYRNKNKTSIQLKKKEYDFSKRQNDDFYKLKGNIRSLIKMSIKNQGYKKTSKTYQILGCSFEKFKTHIENQFLPWMNWDNYGKYNGKFEFGWDYDHIIPISSAMTEGDVMTLSHYTNFQPLCSHINRDIKINKLIF